MTTKTYLRWGCGCPCQSVVDQETHSSPAQSKQLLHHDNDVMMTSHCIITIEASIADLVDDATAGLPKTNSIFGCSRG